MHQGQRAYLVGLGTHERGVPVRIFQSNLKRRHFIFIPSVQTPHVLQRGQHNEIVVGADWRTVHGTDMEAAHLDALPHEIGLEVVPLPEVKYLRQAVRDADTQVRQGIALRDTLEDHAVDVVLLLDDACTIDDGLHGLYPLHGAYRAERRRFG